MNIFPFASWSGKPAFTGKLYANPRTQGVGLGVLNHLRHRLSAKAMAKIVSLLSLDGDIEINADCLEILQHVDCGLAPDQVDKIIDLLPTKHETLLWTAIRTLSRFVKDMNPEHKNKILKALSRIDYDFGYTSPEQRFLAAPRYQEPYCPIPKESIQNKIGIVGGFLDSTCRIKQKLGIGLLACLGDSLPNEYREKIADLLSQRDPGITEVAL